MQNHLHPIKLPHTEIDCNLFLAPLAGFTDAAFRSICVSQGACLTYTEMVSAEGLVRGSKKTEQLLYRHELEKQWGIQLFGRDAETAGKAVRLCAEYRPEIIDLNCGCPVPKVVKTGAGSALLQRPDQIERLVKEMKACVSAYPSPPSITVKIRSGWDSSHINYLETSDAAQSGGADMITLHPRTRAQGYAGKADWDQIAELKQRMQIPVIGSGDLFTPEDALEMFRRTGCDGIMFARGAVGKPFIFHMTRALLSTGDLPPMEDMKEIMRIAWEHYKRALDIKGEMRATKEMKKHFCAYTKGMRGGSSLRNQLVAAQSADNYREILKDYL